MGDLLPISTSSPHDINNSKLKSFLLVHNLVLTLSLITILQCNRHVVDFYIPLFENFISCSDIFPKDKFPTACIFMGKCSEMASLAGC